MCTILKRFILKNGKNIFNFNLHLLAHYGQIQLLNSKRFSNYYSIFLYILRNCLALVPVFFLFWQRLSFHLCCRRNNVTWMTNDSDNYSIQYYLNIEVETHSIADWTQPEVYSFGVWTFVYIQCCRLQQAVKVWLISYCACPLYTNTWTLI